MMNTKFYIKDCKIESGDIFQKIIDTLEKHKLSHKVHVKTDFKNNTKTFTIEFDFYQLINIIDKL